MAREYITLVTSLPHLKHFERAERLPITELALTQRLRMLDEDDVRQLRRAVELLQWRRHPVAATTEQIEQQYRAAMQTISNDALRDHVEWSIGGRTALAALRLKSRGQTVPPEKPWGVGPLVRAIASRWEKPNFGLQGLFPWLDESRRLLESDDAQALQLQQMRVLWQRLAQLSETNLFGFEFVAAYVFKWDILQRWLPSDAQVARNRFQKLVEEVIGEYKFSCA